MITFFYNEREIFINVIICIAECRDTSMILEALEDLKRRARKLTINKTAISYRFIVIIRLIFIDNFIVIDIK